MLVIEGLLKDRCIHDLTNHSSCPVSVHPYSVGCLKAEFADSTLAKYLTNASYGILLWFYKAALAFLLGAI